MRLLLSLLILVVFAPSVLAYGSCPCGGTCPFCAPGDGLPYAPSDGPITYRVQSRWPQPNGPGSPVTLSYSYNNLLDGGLRGPDGVPLSEDYLRAAVEEALGLWASVAPLHFVEVPDQYDSPAPTFAYANGQFGQIRFHHRFINGPDPVAGSPTTKAIAYFPSSSGNLAGDVFYDNGDPWQPIGELSTPDPLGAAVHELGHSLGLGHDSNPDANMYWVFTRSSGLGTASLHPSDIAGIRAIYGAGVGSVTPLLAVPEPASACLLAFAASVVAGRRRVR
ncbi:MAG: matrixin family metalloprotease [Planctomycetota bacterium]